MRKFFTMKFSKRHLGINEEQKKQMLETIGVQSIDELTDKTIPGKIRLNQPLNIPEALSEKDLLDHMRQLAAQNKIFKNFIGMGYYGTFTPPVIQRNIFENPAWYTAYTPYQAEISQGRLEALVNFQTMVTELTGLPIANASLLDEATAAAEAMTMFYNVRKNSNAVKFFVDENLFPQTIDVLITRAEPLGIELVFGDVLSCRFNEEYFGLIVQYPDKWGEIRNFHTLIEQISGINIKVAVAADLLSLCLLTPPGEWGADCVVGSTQRFGIPLGYGGPHAAYFATKEEFKRNIPGRIIGRTIDADGNPAYRMALQTREQHIKRERATSNICTSQVLLAVMAGMYAVYHGPEGLKNIAKEIHHKTSRLRHHLQDLGIKVKNKYHFDTLSLEIDEATKMKIKSVAENQGMNFNYFYPGYVTLSLDEITTDEDVENIIQVFATVFDTVSFPKVSIVDVYIPQELYRQSKYLRLPVFESYHTETEMMRYIKRLESKDLSLVHSMISLGSCTMKLNAAIELMPLSWPEFNAIHPFAPSDQANGYRQIIAELEKYLCEITGFDAASLQPNSGAQGEYAGLNVIREYFKSKGEEHRNIALIPASAHGTNPASAVMAGMEVVVVKCTENGDIDINDLKAKASQYADRLACLMVTYPSTHGVFEEEILEITSIIHQYGGQVYMDGANMNAQVGLTNPARIGADVCHLNLHKTFAIPHGGGGPGMGPICVAKHLAPFLPNHPVVKLHNEAGCHAISAAPWGSALILLISYAYIRLLGPDGLRQATEIAILNANYLKAVLQKEFKVLYTNRNGMVAHEMILDCRPFKLSGGVDVIDIAKRLMDYGFHAPTVSFPVAGTLMIEPTESENKQELDRFCNALISIKKEIEKIAGGNMDKTNNPLKNAPHTMQMVCSDKWEYPYSRQEAAFPDEHLYTFKFWPAVRRVNDAYGDRNLVCTCAPIESYMDTVN